MTSAHPAGVVRRLARLAACAALPFLLLCDPARAQGVSAELAALHVSTGADGQERLQPAREAKPGDLLEYRVIYRNTGAATAARVEATLPIPQDTVYEVAAAKDLAPQASLDGKCFEPTPLKRNVTLPDGRKVLETVPTTAYRWLRWPLGDLAKNQAATVRARVRVQSNAAAQAAPPAAAPSPSPAPARLPPARSSSSSRWARCRPPPWPRRPTR